MRPGILCCAALAVHIVLARADPGPAAVTGAGRTWPDRDGRTVLLAADIWPPFTLEGGGAREGYMVEVARLAFAQAGRSVQYVNVGWERALQGTARGLFDGAVGASAVDGKGLVLPDQELARNHLGFLVRRGDPWRFRGVASLDSVCLGVVQGYDYRDWLNQWIRAHRGDPGRVQALTGRDALPGNLRKLLAGRVDVIVDCELTLLDAARQAGCAGEVALAGRDGESALCTIAFTPAGGRGRALADEFDRGLAQLRADGRLDSLLALYGLEDWRKPATPLPAGRPR